MQKIHMGRDAFAFLNALSQKQRQTYVRSGIHRRSGASTNTLKLQKKRLHSYVFIHSFIHIYYELGPVSEKAMAPHSSTLAWNPMDGGAWWAAVHGVDKSRTRLSDFTFTFHFHALEKEMATHSSVLAWRIPGVGEPRGLPSMGLQRVRHNWSNLASAAVAGPV